MTKTLLLSESSFIMWIGGMKAVTYLLQRGV